MARFGLFTMMRGWLGFFLVMAVIFVPFVSIYGQDYCVAENHQTGRNEDSNKIDKRGLDESSVLSAMRELGFLATFTNGRLVVRGDRQVIGKFVGFAQDDRVLLTLISLYRELKSERMVAQENVLEDSLEKVFSDESNGFEDAQKLAILSTLLPDMMIHAGGSGANVTLRKLNETKASLSVIEKRHYDIRCVRDMDDRELEITFPVRALVSEEYLSASVVNRSNSVQGYTENVGSVVSGRIECHAVLVGESAVNPVEWLDRAMLDTLCALNFKDNEGITEGMGRIVDGLIMISDITEVDLVWSLMPYIECALQTIELLALEQQHLMELIRLDRTMVQVLKSRDFYMRLKQFGTCSAEMTGPFAKEARRLGMDNKSDYEWVINNFDLANQKGIDTAFSNWTRRNAKAVKLRRSLLVSWVAWSRGEFRRAASYALGVTDNKSAIAHPQLHSYHFLLESVSGTNHDRQRFEIYVRVMLLKMPALAFETLCEMFPWLDRSSRDMVVDIVRKYPPSLSALEAARFFKVYEAEFRRVLTQEQLLAIHNWLDRVNSSHETVNGRNRRYLTRYGELLAGGDYRGIASLMSQILNMDESMPAMYRTRFLKIKAYSESMMDAGFMGILDTSMIQSDDSSFEECTGIAMLNKQGHVRSLAFLNSVSRCWTVPDSK